jgi:hypothetical protein
MHAKANRTTIGANVFNCPHEIAELSNQCSPRHREVARVIYPGLHEQAEQRR